MSQVRVLSFRLRFNSQREVLKRSHIVWLFLIIKKELQEQLLNLKFRLEGLGKNLRKIEFIFFCKIV